MYPLTRFKLYHHAFLVTKDEKWAVIQQGMSEQDHSARRYHWLSENTRDLVVEPHSGIVGIKRARALNMVAKTSEAARKASVDLAKEPTRKLMNLIGSASKPLNQASLQQWLPKTSDPWQQTLFAICFDFHRDYRVYCFVPFSSPPISR